MLILGAEDVRRALPMGDAIGAMRTAFGALVQGRAQVPLRSQLASTDGRGVTLVMPAHLSDEAGDALAVKVVSVFPANPGRGLARIQGTVLVLDPSTGRVEGVLEGATLTALRTGAVSGLATELLAREDARVAAIFGAGVQGRTQLEAVCTARRIERVLVCDPVPGATERFVEELAGVGPIPEDVQVATPREAVSEADVICTATISTDPVFEDPELKPGVHINAVGSYQPHVREIPPETVVRARVVVDDREAALEETGDLIQPIEAGLITAAHIRASLGELVLGEVEGRESGEQITLFKSVGIAAQDAAAARVALEGARALGLGQWVE